MPDLNAIKAELEAARKALDAVRANVEQSLKDGYGCPFCKRADGQYVDGEYWHDDDCPYELLVPKLEIVV
jgi:hypothetical protein